MPNKIERLSSVTSSLSITASATTTPVIPFGAAAGGTVYVDSVSGAGSISWVVMHDPEGTNYTTSESTSISASNAYAIPDALYAAPFLKAVCNSGTAVITVSLKG